MIYPERRNVTFTKINGGHSVFADCTCLGVTFRALGANEDEAFCLLEQVIKYEQDGVFEEPIE